MVTGVWLAAFQLPDKNLHVVACDVGQGDAILVTAGSVQILTDGGPNNKVLSCLSKYMPFWDRKIELVVLTHPEKDHYFGLIEVFRRYKIANFLYNPALSGSQGYGVLEKEVGREGATLITPDAGRSIRVGLISLDILWPDNGSQLMADSGTNNFSIVTLFKFAGFEALLTGDIEDGVSDEIASLLVADGKQPIEYIKVPHHGSKNGLSENLLKATDPKFAVISVGKNSYGHPHEEVLKILRDYDTRILRTDEMGDIEVVTDGEKYWLER